MMQEMLFDIWDQVIKNNDFHRVLSCIYSGRSQLPCSEDTNHPVKKSTWGGSILLPTVITNLPAIRISYLGSSSSSPSQDFRYSSPGRHADYSFMRLQAKTTLLSHSAETIQKINICDCFKILNLRVICFPTIDNEYIYSFVYTYLH